MARVAEKLRRAAARLRERAGAVAEALPIRRRRVCSSRCRRSMLPRHKCQCVCGGARHGSECQGRTLDLFDGM